MAKVHTQNQNAEAQTSLFGDDNSFQSRPVASNVVNKEKKKRTVDLRGAKGLLGQWNSCMRKLTNDNHSDEDFKHNQKILKDEI